MTTSPSPPVAADLVIDGQTPPGDVIRAMGFDLDQVQAVVLTAASAVAIAADYPEPINPPQEAPDGH